MNSIHQRTAARKVVTSVLAGNRYSAYSEAVAAQEVGRAMMVEEYAETFTIRAVPVGGRSGVLLE